MKARPPYGRPQSRYPWAPADLDPFYTDLLVDVLVGSVRAVQSSIVRHTSTKSEIVTGPASVLLQLGLVRVCDNGVLELTHEAYDEMFPALVVVR